MKKVLFTVAVAAIAMVGCVSNETEVSYKSDAKIEFSVPLVSGVTRVVPGEIANPYSTDEKFVVNAMYYTETFTKWSEGQPYMEDVVAEYSADDNAWAPTHVHYWPKTGSLTFMAYSPAEFGTWTPAIGGTDVESLAASSVTIPYDASVDLLYSALAKDKKANDNIAVNNYRGVEIKFNHALSSIVFKVGLTNELDSETKIVVKSVKLANVNSVGNFSWNLDENAAPQWSNQTTPKEYIAVSNASQEVTLDAVKLDNAHTLILLPQVMAGATSEQNVKAVVSYSIVSGETSIAQTSTVDLSKLTYATQATAEWKPGKRYIYTIKFGMDKILFDPEVKNWEDISVSANK